MENTVPEVLKLNEIRFFSSVFCLYFAYSILRRSRELLRWYASHRGLFPGRQIFGVWKPLRLSQAMLATLLAVLALTLLINVVWPSRWGVALAIVLYFATFPGLTDFHLVGHSKSTLTPIVLFFLLLSNEAYAPPFHLDGAGGAGVDGGWPLVAIRSLIAVVYFALGIEKLLATGWRWGSGKALRWFLIEHYGWGGFRPARYLINRPVVLGVLSSVTLGMQLLAPLIVLGWWLPAAHAVVALGFHLSTQIFMGIYFLPFFGPIVVSSALTYPFAELAGAFLTIENPVVASLTGAGPPPESATWCVVAMFLIVGLQVVCQVTRRHWFPFLPYHLFSDDFSDFRRPSLLLLEIGDGHGSYEPWRPRDSYDVRDVSHLGYDLVRRRPRLSSTLEASFRRFYWPVMQRESRDGGSGIRSVRLVWRFPAWQGDTLIRYDDFLIGEIPIRDGEAGEVRLLEPSALRSTPL